ncbi:MAG: HlyD family efflux transporter periplasmic adaptor subunit [Pseudomonadota bacterium]
MSRPQVVTTNESSAAPEQDGSVNNLSQRWLAFYDDVRAIDDERHLFAHLCNAARRILGFRQAFVLTRTVKNAPFKVVAASSIAVVDRDAPMIRWIEKLATRLSVDVGEDGQHAFSLPAYCDETDPEATVYPFPELLWTPFKDGAETVGGYIVARETDWRRSDREAALRIADIYAHAWRGARISGKMLRNPLMTDGRKIAAAAMLAIIAALPTPITALAPAEAIPRDPFIVAAPFDGVIREMLVEPGSFVENSAPLIRFEDVQTRNEYSIATEQAALAAARYRRASQSALTDARAKREIAVAKAEFDLATAEKRYAGELLEKTTLSAVRAGHVVYSDKRDWIGRPVAAGEAILQIADANDIHFAIDLPVGESLVLKPGARIKVFLESDPLKPLDAVLVQTSYHAAQDKRGVLAFRATARLESGQTPPRIGVQGTAKIYGDRAPLIYVLLRRPLSALRQWTGW